MRSGASCLRVQQPAWQPHQSPGARWTGHLAVRSTTAPGSLRMAEGSDLDANDAHTHSVRRPGDRTAVGAYRHAKRNRLGVNRVASSSCSETSVAIARESRKQVTSREYSVIMHAHDEPLRARDSGRAAAARTDSRTRRAAERAAAPEP